MQWWKILNAETKLFFFLGAKRISDVLKSLAFLSSETVHLQKNDYLIELFFFFFLKRSDFLVEMQKALLSSFSFARHFIFLLLFCRGKVFQ